MKKIRTTYILLKADYPLFGFKDKKKLIIDWTRVIVDSKNKRGEKLTYKKKTDFVFQVKVWKFYINIPLIFNGSKSEIVESFRPYKKFWSKTRGKVSHNDWGVKDHVLTHMWYWLEKEIINGVPNCGEKIKDHTLIAHLKKRQKTFYFINQF